MPRAQTNGIELEYETFGDPSRSLGAGVRIDIRISGFGWPICWLPVDDMMEVSDSTRSGCRHARVCAIIPPIEAPTTCAASISSTSSSPAVSSAMSSSV